MATIANLDINLNMNLANFTDSVMVAEGKAKTFGKQIESQIATFGMNTREARLYGLAQAGANEEVIAGLRVGVQHLAMLEEQAAAAARAKQITDAAMARGAQVTAQVQTA